ncbi:MAG TPA: C1 family peptidase [Polyangiaceae bacterium]
MLKRIVAALALVACQTSGASTQPTADAGAAQVAPNEKGAPKAPPPLKVVRAPVPPLPDLPELQNHEPPQSIPLEARLGALTARCRNVWDGTEVVASSCAKAALMGGAKEGATPLITHATLRGGPKVPVMLPAVIDHRFDGTEGPVRNQASVPACTAFAEAAALDHALARWSQKPPHVSVMELWSRYHTAAEQNAIDSNVSQPVCAEEDWPFAIPEATSWLPCDEVANKKKYGCGQAVNDGHAKRADARPVAHVTRVVFLKQPDAAALRTILAAGQDVVVTMSIPNAFVPRGRPGARYIPHYTSVQNDQVGHAMVLAGYAHFAHGTYFLLHNSWGPMWGDGGYAWIHEATLAKWTREYLIIDAEPTSVDGRKPVRARGETTCEGELVPDSLGGKCAPRCADGSPRHDGVCPAAKNPCPAGYVNLTGTCVIAAPTTSGTDPQSGIAWRCGAGGCTYDLPRAVDPSCTGNTCRVSCPAPDYRPAREGDHVTCIY